MDDLPAFDENLELQEWNEAQPLAIRDQGCFVAIIQWDGTGDHRHRVLIRKDEVEQAIEQLRKIAGQR